MSTDQDYHFHKLLKRYYGFIEQHYLKQLERARDKEFVLSRIKKEIDIWYDHYAGQEPRKTLIDSFITSYKRGEPIDEILQSIKRMHGDLAKQAFKAGDIKNYKGAGKR